VSLEELEDLSGGVDLLADRSEQSFVGAHAGAAGPGVALAFALVNPLKLSSMEAGE
jgi:hypothetical protein